MVYITPAKYHHVSIVTVNMLANPFPACFKKATFTSDQNTQFKWLLMATSALNDIFLS